MENFETALILMVVGMTTVFAILLLLIYLSKALIALVNKYVPLEVAPVKRATATAPATIPANVLAVISAAVTVVTQGKGKAAKVEKI